MPQENDYGQDSDIFLVYKFSFLEIANSKEIIDENFEFLAELYTFLQDN